MDIIKTGIEHVLYPYMEKKRGNHVREYTEELKKSSSFSELEIKALQEKKLKELLLFCAENVPAYSYLDKNEIEKDPWGVLQTKVQPLKKADFRNYPESFLAANVPESSRIPNVTGGSTGMPLKFFMDRFQVEHYEAARWRGLSWHGVTYGSRSVMLWGNPVELDKNKLAKYSRKEKLLKNRVIISSYEMSDAKAPEYVKLLNDYNPEYLYGYSSALYYFAKIIEKYGVEKLKNKLKVIVFTSEAMAPDQQEYVRKVFKCPVVGEYGARDGGILAYGCKEGKFHITAENAIIEVLDPVTYQPVSEGQVGTLAVTDLNSRVQPRLRYVLGDMAVLSSEKCTCGCNLPLLAELAGREDDMLVRMDGSLAYGVMVAMYVRNYEKVKQCRFVQHTKETATLYLVMDEDPELAEKVVKDISNAMGGTKIELKLVDELQPSASGKMRYAIREFPLE